MTEKEALLFFPYDEQDDLEDLWEERFFEQKQFFLTRPPIAKVFLSKLKKLEKQYLAYLTLKNEDASIRSLDLKEYHPHFPENIIAAFNQFHQSRNDFKHQLLKAEEFPTLKNIIESWLNLENKYHSLWYFENSLNDQIDVVKSKEPDPMIILDKLKMLSEEKNIQTFQDLRENYNDLDEDIRNEVKRLTLLSKN